MTEISGKAFDLPIFKRVMRYVKPYIGWFWLTAILTILLAFLSPARPWLIQYTLDHHILIPDPDGLMLMTILLIGTLVAEAVFQYYQSYLANWLGQTVIKDLRVDVFRHITGLKLKYFDNTAIGTLVTRAVSDIETIADIFSEGILIIIGDILKLIVVIAVMFYTDWRLTLFSLASLPLLLIATYFFKNVVKQAFQDVRTRVSQLNAFVQEHITGINIVQAFNREEEEMKKFKDINALHRDAHIRSIWAYSIFFPVVEVLSALSLGLLVWWGAREVISGTVTFGSLVAFILYIYMLFRPIRQLADRFNVLQMGIVSSHRVFRVLDTDDHIENNGQLSASGINGEIEFKNLWFAYNNEEWVLKDISFKAEPGTTLALVGETGSGKTSIANLICRFYEYNKGAILIDGNRLENYQLDELRNSVGMVLQDVFLYSDSILNNITLNNAEISREKVINAARMVGVHDFIKELPGGYDYDVRERGGMLSVGQRQLIAFIRAYVYDPKVLILDEATSSVDTESEVMIQYAIDKLTQNRTSIVIAHRLATIQKADHILVLNDGKIIEQGNHQELLRLKGRYKKLFDLQFQIS